MQCPHVRAFFDLPTSSYSYVVWDPATRRAAVIDSVLGFDAAAGRTDTAGADAIIDFVRQQALGVDWIIETHVHADHLSAAPHVQAALGGQLAIGEHVGSVQQTFAALFNAEPEFATDGSQFGHLFADSETWMLGDIAARAMHTPGHTAACTTHLIGDAAFVGDTIFMPDYGTARCDFPGGDAATLYRSIQQLYALPDATRVFLCHDYKAPGRATYACETTIGAQRRSNVHLREGTGEADFVALRNARDAKLDVPRLLLPAVQVNMRAGRMPAAEANATRYLKIPLDRI